MVSVAFIGHVCVDVNVVHGLEQVHHGGGVVHGAITAQRLGARAVVHTKCAAEDQARFTAVFPPEVQVVFHPSERSTSIRNDYPTENPDDRRSRLLCRAASFSAAELQRTTGADVVHVSPLWRGELADELFGTARSLARFLCADAQGFVRAVREDGGMELRDWPQKDRVLPLLDCLKVDNREAQVLTGETDLRSAARALTRLGARRVLLTHREGVLVDDGARCFEARFGAYPMEGRTGRGDTCTAAFLVAQSRFELGPALEHAARVTTEKLQHAGPFRGRAPWDE